MTCPTQQEVERRLDAHYRDLFGAPTPPATTRHEVQEHLRRRTAAEVEAEEAFAAAVRVEVERQGLGAELVERVLERHRVLVGQWVGAGELDAATFARLFVRHEAGLAARGRA